MYAKLIVSKNVIEFYQMENTPYNPHLEDYESEKKRTKMAGFREQYVNDHGELWSRFIPYWKEQYDQNMEFHKSRQDREDRREERRAQTMRDARNKIKRLACANFDEKSLFVTLTYAENLQDVGQADEDFREFIKEINDEFGKKHKYIAVREFQERGAVHYHMLIDLDITWDEYDKERREYFERLVHDLYWSHGWVDLKRMDIKEEGKRKKYNDRSAVDNVGAYLIKYMSKEFDDERLEGKKLYLCSQGLDQPKVYTDPDEIVMILQSYGKEIGELEEKKKVYEKSYDSEYLGKIKYLEYNLNRL